MYEVSKSNAHNLRCDGDLPTVPFQLSSLVFLTWQQSLCCQACSFSNTHNPEWDSMWHWVSIQPQQISSWNAYIRKINHRMAYPEARWVDLAVRRVTTHEYSHRPLFGDWFPTCKIRESADNKQEKLVIRSRRMARNLNFSEDRSYRNEHNARTSPGKLICTQIWHFHGRGIISCVAQQTLHRFH